MLHVLFYESGDRVAELGPVHYPAHRERWAAFAGRGELLMIGPFADQDGAMAVFTTDEAARSFAAGDPFVVHGVVSRWYVREWLEALVGEPQ